MDPIFSALENAQRTLLGKVSDSEPVEWWRKDPLNDALRKMDRSWGKRKRDAAFDLIRAREVPGWHYKQKGKRSAYILERFLGEPSLPGEFRATADDIARADDARLRSRILQAIAMAIDDYRARSSRGPAPSQDSHRAHDLFQRELRRVVEPYVGLVDAMLAKGASRTQVKLRWESWLTPRVKALGWRPDALNAGSASDFAGDEYYPRLAFEWLLQVRDELEGRPEPALRT